MTAAASHPSLPILQTKLFVPPVRSNHLPRAHLLDRLDAGLDAGKKVTLISAPAGYGKTTLAATWGSRLSPMGVSPAEGDTLFVWLSLDGDDNDPIRFFAYVVAALQPAVPAAADELQPLLTGGQVPLVQFVPRLLNVLARLERRLVLVLDDFHAITDAAIHDSMTQMLEFLPPLAHLVLTTRRDPPLPLARLRVRGQLQEIRVPELQFDNAEVTRFLHESMGVDLPASDVSTLAARTEGWIASLQLAALSLQELDRPSARHRFIETFGGSHRHVVDYLLDEVLSQQPSGTRDFLLETSILPRLCADLCNVVTGGDDGQAVLEQLDKANFFVVPLDYDRHWYRYHHLFTTLLQQRLQQRYPDRVAGLHARAVTWFANEGLDAEAIDVALQGGDAERAAQLLIDIAKTAVWQEGQYVRLAYWIEQLPESIMAQHPQLCVYYGWGLLVDANRADAAASARWLALAEQNSGGETPAQRDIRGQIAAIRASRTRVQAEIDRTIELATYALDHLLPDSFFWQALSYFNLAAVYYLGDDIDAIEQALVACKTTAETANDTLMVIAAINLQGQLQVRLGRPQEAARLFKQAMAVEQKGSAGQLVYFTSGMSPLGLGSLHQEWNRLDEAADWLQQGLAIGRQTHHPLALTSGQIAQAQLMQARGKTAAAKELMQQASRLLNLTGINWTWLTGPTSAALARLWLQMGEPALARKTLHEAQTGLSWQPGMSGYWDECWHLVEARLLLAEAKHDEALALLQQLEKAAAAAARTGSQIEILILLARAQQEQGQRETAVATLAQALALAEPGEYVRTFLNEGAALARLLTQLPANSYRDRLLAAFGQPAAEVDQTVLVEPLNARELQILRLMAARLSNREIGDELFLATTTIKWYSRQIYGKLGVNSRKEAVAKAQELGVL